MEGTSHADRRPRMSVLSRITAFPFLREPILHFLLLGIAIYIGVSLIEQHSARYRITLGPSEIERVKLSYAQQFGSWPTSTQLDALIDRYVREEIYFREGHDLGLDRDDEIVRRRVAQKFEFLQQDLAIPDDPSPTALQTYFTQHAAHYAEPVRVSFSQIYFSPDRDGAASARARAMTVSARLDGPLPPKAQGDPFPGQSEVVAFSAADLSRFFGQSEIIEKAFAAPLGRWSGPYRSGYGWHLIRVTARTESTMPTIETIQDRVKADYLEDQRRAQNESAYADLRKKYQISIQGRSP